MPGRLLATLALTLAVSSSAGAVAQTQAGNGKAPENEKTGNNTDAERSPETVARQEFQGISFGVGIAGMIPFSSLGADNRVEEAVLAGDESSRFVRVVRRHSTSARVILETHYFFTPGPAERFGIGPFVALQPGTEKVINALGGGVLTGLRRENRSQSFNVGAGVMVEPEVRDLGDGIMEDEPLPAGETEIRYQTLPTWSFVLIASFGFE